MKKVLLTLGMLLLLSTPVVAKSLPFIWDANDPLEGVLYYTIYIDGNTVPGSETITNTQVVLEVSNLSPGQHTAVLTATNEDGESIPSDTQYFNFGAPSKPVNFRPNK